MKATKHSYESMIVSRTISISSIEEISSYIYKAGGVGGHGRPVRDIDTALLVMSTDHQENND